MTGEFAVAVHALVFLNHRQETVSSETLAANICTNGARVRKVMAKLKKAGLVDTRAGAEGGYLLHAPAGEITLAHIARALQVEFISSTWRSGSKDLPCMVACGMADVLDGLYREMNDLCMEKMEKTTVEAIGKQLKQAAKEA